MQICEHLYTNSWDNQKQNSEHLYEILRAKINEHAERQKYGNAEMQSSAHSHEHPRKSKTKQRFCENLRTSAKISISDRIASRLRSLKQHFTRQPFWFSHLYSLFSVAQFATISKRQVRKHHVNPEGRRFSYPHRGQSILWSWFGWRQQRRCWYRAPCPCTRCSLEKRKGGGVPFTCWVFGEPFAWQCELGEFRQWSIPAKGDVPWTQCNSREPLTKPFSSTDKFRNYHFEGWDEKIEISGNAMEEETGIASANARENDKDKAIVRTVVFHAV